MYKNSDLRMEFFEGLKKKKKSREEEGSKKIREDDRKNSGESMKKKNCVNIEVKKKKSN